MNKKLLWILSLILTFSLSGCAKKADPNRSIEQIQKDVPTMSTEELESYAEAYAEALQEQKAKLSKIQEKMRTMPVEKIFENDFLTNRVKKIGHQGEALFDRYVIYMQALEERGADLSKFQLD